MARAVITGEAGLWSTDLQSGATTAVTEPFSKELSKLASLRRSGVTLIKGVDFAIAVSAGSVYKG